MISTRDMAQSADTEHRAIFSSALLLQLAAAVALSALGLPFFHASLPEIAGSLTVGTLTLLGALILQVSQAILVSREQISKVVVASIFGHLVATGAIAWAAERGASVTFLVGAWASFNVAQGALLFLQARAWETISLSSVSFLQLKKLASQVLPVLVMILATHLYVRIDVVMLDYFTDKVVVAQYSAGYLFLDQLMILSNFMMSALFPNFARSLLEEGNSFKLLYRGILRLFLTYLVPLALVIALFSKALLNELYGADYAAGWPSLSLLMIAALFAWINGPSGTIFISLRKQHLYMWATLLSLVVNVLGNVILIPLMGAPGAALSTVATEFALCWFCLYWIYRNTGYLPWMKIESKASNAC